MTNEILVWFKRDLRVHDHAALSSAARYGRVRCLWVLEPSLWQAPDASVRQLGFALESARDLDAQLRGIGTQLHVHQGEVPEVLDRIYQASPFAELHSHQETGNALSYRRDRAVAQWCTQRGVRWREHAQFAVVRRLRSRDGWGAQRESFVMQPQCVAPRAQCIGAEPWAAKEWKLDAWQAALGMAGADAPARQRGGREAALSVLQAFLAHRSQRYRGGISSPDTAAVACSRLSPYLTWGCLSLREVEQATQMQLAGLPPQAEQQRRGLQAFAQRLAWHCHFIQKLETEPELEWRNLHRGYDGLRESDHSEARLLALQQGRTGWPLVDACVAMLRETGWLNFRMRAMLVSVAAYPLWLHWRPVGLWLAKQFVDYEPGIHWSQLQMQSGTTGINTTRIYNPIKQAQELDPSGRFVRRWLPAMRRVPDTWLFEPWRMPMAVQRRCAVEVGQDIAEPLVDYETAVRAAKTRFYAVRSAPEVKALEPEIVRKHASRMYRSEHTGRALKADASLSIPGQLDLF